MFKKIDDSKVQHIWKCSQNDCVAEPIYRETSVRPNWYELNGTPVCECGYDMKYSHTEIDI